MEILFLIIAGFLIYFYSSRDSRRDKAVENRIRRMLDSNTDMATFEDLYFEAASSYAKSKGSRRDDWDANSVDTMIDGKSLSVTFLREIRGGTTICIESTQVRDQRFSDLMDSRFHNSKQPQRESMSRSVIIDDLDEDIPF